MGFMRRIPTSIDELEQSINKLQENRGHVSSIKLNEAKSQIEVDLDWTANHVGGDAGKDFYLPIKSGKLPEAKQLVDKLFGAKGAPSRADVQVLYDMIDPQGA